MEQHQTRRYTEETDRYPKISLLRNHKRLLGYFVDHQLITHEINGLQTSKRKNYKKTWPSLIYD